MIELVLFNRCESPILGLYDDLLFRKKWFIPMRIIQDCPNVSNIIRSSARIAAKIVSKPSVSRIYKPRSEWKKLDDIIQNQIDVEINDAGDIEFSLKDKLSVKKQVEVFNAGCSDYVNKKLEGNNTSFKSFDDAIKIYKTHDSLGRPIPKRDKNGKFVKKE